jgi:N-acetylgalactosamine-6-sulfatase
MRTLRCFCCILVVLLLAGRAAPSAAETRPNIVFIFADDWGWGDLSCHDHPHIETPNLDRLAGQGTEFWQFTVNNPVCSPSRTAVMTGQFPARHCVHQHFASVEHQQKAGMPDWLDPKVPLLTRFLKQHGYAIGHFGKWHLTNSHVPDPPPLSEYAIDDSAVFNGPGRQTKPHEVFDHAIRFIRENRNQPFFMNVWIHESHTPHYPEADLMNHYEELDEQHQVYAAVITGADRQIGRVLDVIDQFDLADRTLVVFSSDNGPEQTGPVSRKKLDDETGPGLGTYYSVGTTGGMKGRKRSLFEGGVRIPFFVRWPGKVPAGSVDKQTVITAVDLLPTFCAAAGLDLPGEYRPDGENMLPAFLGKSVTRSKPIFWEWRGNPRGDNWPRLAVRDGDWKLVMTVDRSRIELYRIPNDRFERDNLADRRPEIVKRLAEKALQWKSTLPTEPPSHCFSKTRN